jgi:general secretion pathway protein G
MKRIILWTAGVVIFACFGLTLAFKFWDNLDYNPIFTVETDLNVLTTQLEVYKQQNGTFPTTAQGLHALVERPNSPPEPHDWVQRLNEEPRDPWHHMYVYRFPSERDPNTFDLFSLGPDGVQSDDDISLQH